MIENNDNKIPYEENKSENKATGKTIGSDRGYQKGEVDDFKNAIANAYNKTPIPKLFLTLSMVIYGVIAYSKGKEGISVNDLSLFAFFILFVVIVFVILTISAYLYRGFINKLLKFSNKKDLSSIFIVSGLLLLLCIIFKSQLINSIENFIRISINF